MNGGQKDLVVHTMARRTKQCATQIDGLVEASCIGELFIGCLFA
jgi:hypothetical protein